MFVEAGGSTWQDGFRECVIAIMELAELLECVNVVMCVGKTEGDLMRSFVYAGFEMIHPNIYCPKDGFVLLGCEV